MTKITGKRALVTGAASGIGRELALELARKKVRLCLVDRQQKTLEETAELCRGLQTSVTTCLADLTAPDVCETICQHVRETLGGLDLLINNAGIVFHGRFEEMSAAQLTQLTTVNLTAPLQLTLACLPWLLENPGSYILNVASMYAWFPTQQAAAYHATKSGLFGFSQALRAEYARYELGVGCLCPGFVHTGLFDSALTGDGHQLIDPPRWMTTTSKHVARVGVRMIVRNQGVKPVTPIAHLVWHTRQWLPGLIDWYLHRTRKIPHPYRRPAEKRLNVPSE